MFSVVVHLVKLVSNHMLRWIGLKLVTMWIAQKCISVNTRIHIQSGLKLVRNCSVNRPLKGEKSKYATQIYYSLRSRQIGTSTKSINNIYYMYGGLYTQMSSYSTKVFLSVNKNQFYRHKTQLP